MLKFFRNIRLQLLSESQTIQYLKYTIGKIVLVVTGILIAEELEIQIKKEV